MAKDINQFRSFVLQNNPNISKDQLAQLDDFVYQQQATSLARQGVDPSIVGNPNLTNVYSQAGIVPQASKSQAEEKLSRSKSDAAKRLALIENTFYNKPKAQEGLMGDNVGGGLPILAKIAGLLKTGASKVGLNPSVTTYNNLVEQSAPFLARAAGEVGSMSNLDIEKATKLLPSQYSTTEEAQRGFQTIREMLGLEQSPRAEVGGMSNVAQAPQNPMLEQATNVMRPQTTRLQNAQGQVIEYDNPNDPEIRQALQAGYQPM